MFKSVLNSLNGSAAPAAGQSAAPAANGLARRRPDDNDDGASSSKSNDSESTTVNGGRPPSKSAGGRAMRMISVKVGRKKLSSMMSKFGRSSAKKRERAEQSEEDSCGSDGNEEEGEDEEDDEEAYKSAEEACRKMSLSDKHEKAACRRASILSRRGRKASAAAPACAAGAAAENSSAYEQLKGDKKYILPEEQCDIPTFLQTKNCPLALIEETRRLLKERYAKNPDNFYDADYARMLTDDWTVSRFLLRRRLDPKRTAKLMEECGRFRKQYKMSEVELWEFPKEFHQAGGLFKYAPDRVGNVTMYMRVKMYRRVPEISDVFKAFILCVLEQCDVANGGRGTAVVFDLSACGLQNVDLGFLSWLLSSFRNYCPKGVSYIVVYNLPWILNATCKLAMTWMSASNKRALRFVYGDEIENFIDKSNLPDYLGGACKLNYRAIPPGSKPAIEVCDRLDMTREQAIKIRELFKEYLNEGQEASERADERPQQQRQQQREDQANQSASTSATGAHDETRSHYDDAKSSTSLETIELEPSGRHAGGARAPVVELVSQASKFIAH